MAAILWHSSSATEGFNMALFGRAQQTQNVRFDPFPNSRAVL
jgi:hypothetical protein